MRQGMAEFRTAAAAKTLVLQVLLACERGGCNQIDEDRKQERRKVKLWRPKTTAERAGINRRLRRRPRGRERERGE
jgi:hypothetical protein